MSGKYALIIGNNEYTDSGLAQLSAPGRDAEDFARVLNDKDIGAFDSVNVLVNQPSSSVLESIDEFFDQKKPDDMLVLYFSGHGIKDEIGSLYLAFKNTIRSRLRATAIKSDYIREAMDQSRSKRQVLILDCCNSGAFPQGTKAELGGAMGMAQAFQGYGRFVLTASDATQFAWEGDKVIGETDNSLFTHFLVKGLEGEADSDGDGRITVDELYDYAYDQISSVTPKQTPTKSASKQEGEIILRQITRIEDIKPIPLPDDLISEIEDTRPYVREAAVQKLGKIIRGKNIGMARSAIEALEKIAADENTTRRVAQEALQAMESFRQTIQKPEDEDKAIKKVDEKRSIPEKTGRKTETNTDALRQTNRGSEVVQSDREREQPERLAQVIPPKQVTEKKPPAQQVKQQLSPRVILIIAGIIFVSIFCIGGGWAIKNILFPISATQPRPTTEPTHGNPNEVALTTTWTTTTATTPTETTFTFTPTFILTSTVTPFAPPEPDQFINFYFDTIIYSRNYILGWSLLTDTFKANNNPTGFDDWKATWEKVVDWKHPDWTTTNTAPAMVIVYTPEIWFYSTAWYSLTDRQYCLVRDESRNTWMIESKAVCGF